MSVGPQVPWVTVGWDVIETRRLLCRNPCAAARFARPKIATRHEIQKLRRLTIEKLLPPEWLRDPTNAASVAPDYTTKEDDERLASKRS